MARIPLLMKMLSHRSNEILQHETVRQLMQSRRQFDLFVLGYHFNEPLLGIAGHFRCPSVIISTSPAMKSIRDFAGSPASIATTPIFSKIGKRDHNPPTFWERFGLFIAYTLEYIIVLIVTQFLHKPIYAKHFPTAIGYPTYDEVQTNVSLVLVNHHFSHGDFRPVYPNIVDIGGIQIRAEPEPLSEVRFSTSLKLTTLNRFLSANRLIRARCGARFHPIQHGQQSKNVRNETREIRNVPQCVGQTKTACNPQV